MKKLLGTLCAFALTTGAAAPAFADGHAEKTMLRIQTHYAPETPSGKLAAEFIDDIQTMSNGEIEVEMFYSSSVVKSAPIRGVDDFKDWKFRSPPGLETKIFE